MRFIYILPIILLTACNTLKTPNERYYAMTVAATEVLNVVEKYVDNCVIQPEDAVCRKNLPKIHTATLMLEENIKGLDSIFMQGDKEYYDLTLTVTEESINVLKDTLNGQ